MPRRKRTTALTLSELRPGNRLYAYLRDSGGTSQERSVSEQRAAIERYAAEHGWTIIHWFVDEATASGDYARRSEFGALLDACRTEPAPVDGVLTYALSRFGRDEFDSQFYRLDLRRHGVQVTSVIDQVPSGPLAVVFEAFIDWKNRTFLDDMSRHVREGLRANVAAGYAPGGKPPTGYRAEPVQIGTRRDGRPRVAARWVIDEATAPRVQEAFRLAAQGRSYADIHRAVQLLGSTTSYLSMFRNRTYLGLYKLGEEEFPGPPALVDAATFAAVQARMAPRSEQAKVARRTASPFLLSGLARCGECGRLMQGDVSSWDSKRAKRRATPYRAYRCRAKGCPVGHVRAELPERITVQTVLDTILTPETFAALLASLRAALADPQVDAELADLDAQEAALRPIIDNLLAAVERGGGVPTELRLQAREAELAALLARRAELQERQALAEVPLGEAELARVLDGMRAEVQSEEVGVARAALRGYVAGVEVWPDRTRVVFRSADVLAVVHGYSAMPPRGFGMIPCTLWREMVDVEHLQVALWSES